MIHLDGIVFSLQRTGGISVMFTEILSRLPRSAYRLVGYRPTAPSGLSSAPYIAHKPRHFERYRTAPVHDDVTLFHSTYYRVPTSRRPLVVTTVYDFVYERFTRGPRRWVHSAQKRAAIARADHIVCISESTRQDMLEFLGGRYASRTSVVPLAAAATFQPLKERESTRQVLFVGSRGGYKNFEAAVRAVARLPTLSLTCVGGGPFTPEETRQLRRELPGRFRWAGFLSNQELNAEYNRSFCLLYPSLYEGFGIPVLEAMQAGCPVVAVRASSVPEVAGEAALLVENGSADALHNALTELESAGRRARIVDAGLQRAKSFSWTLTHGRMANVYEGLIGPLGHD